MNNNFNEGVLNALYEVRCEDFERCFFDDLSEEVDKIGVSNKVDQLSDFVKELLKEDCEKIKEFDILMRDVENAILSEMCFKFKQYYKLGFIDANNLRNELKVFNSSIAKNIDYSSFYDEYFESFSGYFEEYKYDYLRQQPEYKEIANQIKYLKEEYPRVTNLVEDGDIEVLNLEELQKLQELLQLRAKEDFIEQKEVFRLGMKEMFCNLKEMNIIHLTEK